MKKELLLFKILKNLFTRTLIQNGNSKRNFIVSLSVLIIHAWAINANTTEDTTKSGSQDTLQIKGEDGSTYSPDDYYIGVFVGQAKGQNTHVDTEGFANWGNPGASTDYSDTGSVGGLLIGKQLRINGVPVRIELDGTLGDISASTNKLDPKGLDETATSEIPWLVTLKAGIEHQLGPATLFANGGLAVARINNSVIDIDFGPNTPAHRDLDDSFTDSSTQLGWVVGVGGEVPLNQEAKGSSHKDGAWLLRMEGSYINLGEQDYSVNHSGNNSCGAGGPRRPCSYSIKNEVGMIRLAIIRRFSL